MAPPLKSLEGAVIGMIDNAKINTSRLLDHIADILKTRYGVREFLRVRKPDATNMLARCKSGWMKWTPSTRN